MAGAGFTVTEKGGEAVPVPQALTPFTVMAPEVAEAEKSTVMELPVLAPVMDAPAGNDQL